MKPDEFLRRLRRLARRRGLELSEEPGDGAHRKVRLGGRRTIVPMHKRDLPIGTWRAILKQLGLKPDDLD
ncbi:MAG TPA: type II toxin-antitoxin system HicA family toxin [Geminicoccaceae bacterium]|jgi:predicted RNA binding protein YcfA (HicA-like mRNA interferase family)|nr:type II toxin-antitoxin system HicA family toxin [Geminicoccaceae bacterium]